MGKKILLIREDITRKIFDNSLKLFAKIIWNIKNSVLFLRYIISHGKSYTYKNKYCALCNGELEENMSCIKIEPRWIEPSRPQSLQILFDLSELYGEITLNLKIKVTGQSTHVNMEDKCRRKKNGSLTNQNESASLDNLLCSNINQLNINLNVNMYGHSDRKSCEVSMSDYVKQYITMCGQSLSIISLFLLLIMYFSNKLLRNLPGKILICLSLSLLLSQIIFLISTYITKPYAYYYRLAENNTSCDNELAIENKFANIESLFKNIFSQKSYECYLMSLFSHYFHLSFFSWSNIMAYDLYKMFTILSASKNSKKTSKSILNDESDNKIIFIKYSLYGWLMPLIIVAGLFLSQFLWMRMAYSFKTCFISNPIDLLGFFVMPICILLFLNIYFLICSITSIRSVDKLSKKYLRKDYDSNKEHGEASSSLTDPQQTTSTTFNEISSKSKTRKIPKSDNNTGDKKRLVLFAKLFILTGMTWIIGLFSTFQKESFIWYIYIVLNSLQGLFLFVAYAFNRHTQRILRHSSLFEYLPSFLKVDESSNSHSSSSKSSRKTEFVQIKKINT